MLKAIFTLITSLPEILSFIKQIVAWLNEAKDRAERKDLAKKFSEGIEDARVNKDTSKLESLFRGQS